MLTTILTKTLEAGLITLIDAGFGEDVRELKARVFGQDEKSQRERAFNLAFEVALQTLPEHTLLEDASFQEEVVNALLDPQNGFNPQAAAQKFIQTNPQQTRHLKLFFNTLEGELLADEYWGDLLMRYQEVRFREDVLATLAKRGLPTDERPVIQHLIATHNSTIATDGSNAVGPGGVLIIGGVGGNVTIHTPPHPHQAETERRVETRTKYLIEFEKWCQFVPIDRMENDRTEKSTQLEDVYIHLLTRTQAPLSRGRFQKWAQLKAQDASLEIPEEEPLSVIDAAQQNPKMALLGDPGSGKSAFLQHLLGRQARVLLGKETSEEGWEAPLLPAILILRNLPQSLDKIAWEKLPLRKQDTAYLQIFREQLQQDLETEIGVPEFSADLLGALEKGQVLLALDGLDEVPERYRKQVRELVAVIQQEYPLPRIILTCRERSYVGEARQPGFADFTIAPLTDEQIERFCQGWYQAMEKYRVVRAHEVETKAAHFYAATREEHIHKLAVNPMLLTIMAFIHRKEERLPKERVQVFKKAVDLLLSRWQEQKGTFLQDDAELAALLKDRGRKFDEMLQHLAFEAHRLQPKEEEEAVDLRRGTAKEVLEKYVKDANLVNRFLDYVDQRAGLLVARGGEPGQPSLYRFPHRTFQEYLAGCYLLNQPKPAKELLALAQEGDFWTLAVEFGAEEQTYNGNAANKNLLLEVARHLHPAQIDTPAKCRAALWAGKFSALLGLDFIERDEISQHQDFLSKMSQTLAKLLASKLPPLERAEAGRVLASLGDSRREVLEGDVMEFCFVPEGNFSMGEDEEKHELMLPAYWIARYPVTNAQFAEFVTAGGYGYKKYWEEAEQAGVWKQGKVQGRWDHAPRDAPEFFREPFHQPNHPVVGVTWYEGLAYTRWLTQRRQAKGWLAQGWQVHLPSEAEWEKAARGGLQIPTVPLRDLPRLVSKGLPASLDFPLAANPHPTRHYPWGDEFDANAANTTESRIETTSAVGCFPGGASPYGVEEMSGNVWEWTRSIYKGYPYDPHDGREDLADKEKNRVMRGGAFFNDEDFARCSIRVSGLPDYGLYHYGFRVVVSPFLHDPGLWRI